MVTDIPATASASFGMYKYCLYKLFNMFKFRLWTSVINIHVKEFKMNNTLKKNCVLKFLSFNVIFLAP